MVSSGVKVSSQYPYVGVAYDTVLRHVPQHYEGNKQKLCVQCLQNCTRTKSGWHVYTRFFCRACLVPLCRGPPRHCFAVYHTCLTSGMAPSVGQGMVPSREQGTVSSVGPPVVLGIGRDIGSGQGQVAHGVGRGVSGHGQTVTHTGGQDVLGHGQALTQAREGDVTVTVPSVYL